MKITIEFDLDKDDDVEKYDNYTNHLKINEHLHKFLEDKDENIEYIKTLILEELKNENDKEKSLKLILGFIRDII